MAVVVIQFMVCRAGTFTAHLARRRTWKNCNNAEDRCTGRRLSGSEASEHLKRYRPKNELPEDRHKPLWRVFASQFASPLIYILFVAAVISFAMGHASDAVVILIVVLINALIGAVQEGRAEHSMTTLRKLWH